jgi:hypothetical protein
LPQIPQLIASIKPLWDDVINVHLAFRLSTQLATTITLQHLLSELSPSS